MKILIISVIIGQHSPKRQTQSITIAAQTLDSFERWASDNEVIWSAKHSWRYVFKSPFGSNSSNIMGGLALKHTPTNDTTWACESPEIYITINCENRLDGERNIPEASSEDLQVIDHKINSLISSRNQQEVIMIRKTCTKITRQWSL